MTRIKWKLTRALLAEDKATIDEWGGDESGHRFGYSLLRLLAENPDNGLKQIGPGVYLGPKME